MNSRACFTLFAALLVLAALPAGATEWQVDRKAHNEVEFTSTVAGFSFSGITDAIDGYLYWKGDSLFAREGEVYFEVDLRTLETGIGKRDRDMREVLNTKTWPRATYKGKVVSVKKDTTGSAYRVLTKGTFSLHGVKRKLNVAGTVAQEGDSLSVSCEFTVNLPEYRIRPPSMAVFIKVSENVTVRVLAHMKQVKEEEKR